MKSPFFSVKELVCKHVYERYGENAAMFLDEKLIETLNVIREQILCAPMTVNNWHAGGNFTQRGLRCNICELVKSKTDAGKLYLSAHMLGKAVDCNVEKPAGSSSQNKNCCRTLFDWRTAYRGSTSTSTKTAKMKKYTSLRRRHKAR